MTGCTDPGNVEPVVKFPELAADTGCMPENGSRPVGKPKGGRLCEKAIGVIGVVIGAGLLAASNVAASAEGDIPFISIPVSPAIRRLTGADRKG